MKKFAVGSILILALSSIGCTTYSHITDKGYFWVKERVGGVEVLKFCYINQHKNKPVCEEAEQENLPKAKKWD